MTNNGKKDLGKGEVLSSILSGSTTETPVQSSVSLLPDNDFETFRDATKREHDEPIRGESGDSVHDASPPSEGFSLDEIADFRTMRARFTVARNREPDFALHQRGTNITNILNQLVVTPDDDRLIGAYGAQMDSLDRYLSEHPEEWQR